jgi:type II secretory pathway pseudopilin PulG
MHSSRRTDPLNVRHGMTLVEIVAAITLAATLLVSVLTAYGRSVRQARLSERRLTAIRLADRLMAEWFRPGGTPPLPGPGETIVHELAGQPGWSWRLEPIESSARRSSGGAFEQYHLQIVTAATTDAPEQVLTELEFVGYLALPATPQTVGATP